MSENWNDFADGWDSNPDVISYAEQAFASLCEVVDVAGLRVLDFGCGTGLLSERMAPHARHIVGLEPAPKMVAVLEQKALKNVDTLVAELSPEARASQPLLQEKFDLIVASSVCAFLPDYEGTLALLQELLKPGGRFVQWDWMKTSKEGDFGFHEDEVKSAFRQVGLEISSVGRAFLLESPKGTMSVLMGVGRKP